jgi:hypothetical protein
VRPEDRLNLIVGGQKPLGMPGRFETAKDLLSFPRWAMGILNPVVQSLVSAMIGIWSKDLNRLGVAAQLVSHHDPGLPELCHQRAKETPGRLRIPAEYHQSPGRASISHRQ